MLQDDVSLLIAKDVMQKKVRVNRRNKNVFFITVDLMSFQLSALSFQLSALSFELLVWF